MATFLSHASLSANERRRSEQAPANIPDRHAVDDLLTGTGHDNDDPPAAATGQPAAGGHTAPKAGPQVFGDSAYADAATLDKLGQAGYTVQAKAPPTRNSRGLFSKDRFTIDLTAATVTCPAGNTAPIRPARHGGGTASFTPSCEQCPLRRQCTTAKTGRSITVHPRQATLQAARAAQRDPAWQAAYRANRPTVERKIAHFVRRAWGGRHARCRGTARILTDVLSRAAALNLARLAALGLHHPPTGWELAPAG